MNKVYKMIKVHEALSLSLSLFESNSRSFYKMQETLVELGRVHHRLSELGVMDIFSAEPQEFKQALVYAEQARARTLSELMLQRKTRFYPDLFSVSTPLTLQDICRTVQKQQIPVVFLSYCVSKLLMWILVPIHDEVKMKCYTTKLQEEDFENGSFEEYTRPENNKSESMAHILDGMRYLVASLRDQFWALCSSPSILMISPLF